VKSCGNVWRAVRELHPIVHCITNYVTANDCANLLLGCGASPIMADAVEEAEEITTLSASLVLNIGTLNGDTIAAMFRAGAKAAELHHPVVLDPVGAGASALRTETALKLLHEVHPCILRCNISEWKMLAHTGSVSRGVDAADIDRVTPENIGEMGTLLRRFAVEHGCVTAVSGEIDLIAAPDGRLAAIRNGDAMMSGVTGSGCMLSAWCAACAAAEPQDLFHALCAAHCAMGIAGEIARRGLLPGEGNASFRNRMIDAFGSCGKEDWEARCRCELLS